MQRQKLKSSSIAEIGYDREQKVLEILFTSGGLYSYADVPPEVFKVLQTTTSPGVYFASCIRWNYEATCLRPRPKQEKTHGTDETKEQKPKATKTKAKNAQI